jgi:hypothetical protein
MITLDPLTQRVAAIPDGRVFLVFDACRSPAWNQTTANAVAKLIKAHGPAIWRRPTPTETLANPEALQQEAIQPEKGSHGPACP